MAEDILLETIGLRMQALFTRVAAGDDAPPGQLLRLEGLREAAALSGAADEATLQLQMDACCQQTFGETLAQRLGEGWSARHPFPQVPLFMCRAPVSLAGGD